MIVFYCVLGYFGVKYIGKQEDEIMATLTLVISVDGFLLLESTAPCSKADFSLFDIDGEGSGSPFGLANNWKTVEEIQPQEYDEFDTDSFWDAQQVIVKECIEKGIPLPEYVEVLE